MPEPKHATPAHTYTHARPSESLSASPSGSNVIFLEQSRTLEKNSDLDRRTREQELASEIAEYWNVEDSMLVVMEFGVVPVARIHRRMLSMSRKQKLNHVENLGGYFMTCLEPSKKRTKPEAERTDEFYEQYVARQKERGL